jgi:tetratricopeptide (TPR) repeat protein
MIVLPLLLAGACSKDPQTVTLEHILRGDAHAAKEEFREAIIEYRVALQSSPGSSATHFKLGEAYAAISDVRNALPQYVRAADLDPDNLEAQLKAGNLLLLARKYDEVKTRAREILKKHPDSAGVLLMLGNALAGLRSFDEAVAANERATSLDPKRSGLFLNLGALQFISGNKTEAEEAYLKAVETDPKSPDTHLGLATFYWASGRLGDAERAMLTALEIDRNGVSANRQLAALYQAAGRPAQAEVYLKNVVSLANDLASKVRLSDYYVSVGRVPEAIAILEQLTTAKGAFAPIKIRIALIYYVTGRRSEASKQLDEVIAREPKNSDALAIKAHVLLDERKLEDARETADGAVLADQGAVRAHFARGKVMLALGRTDDARKSFREVIRINPRAGEADIELAQVSLRAREIDSAIAFAGQAVDIMPDDIDARLTLARALMVRESDIDRAAAQVRLLLQALPSSAAVHELHGELAIAKGDMATATQAFERALALDPTSWGSLTQLVTMDVKAKRLAKARVRVDAALAKSPNATEALLLAAKTYAANGNSPVAEKYLKRTIELDASNLQAYMTLAGLYLIDRRLDDARDEFIQIAQREPGSVAPATMVGIISEAQGDRATAATWYDKALQIDPRAAPAANNRAWIYAERGENLDAALQLAQIAYAALPGVPEVSDTLGWVYYKKDLPLLALPMMLRTVEMDKDNPQYQFHLGMVYAKKGDDNQARAALRQALQLRPDFEGAEEARRALASLLY